jgi:signal transduction histidine kinase
MKQLSRAARERLEQIRTLTEVSRALSYAASLDEVLRLAVDRAARLLAAEQALLLVANDEGLLVLRASFGVDAELTQRLHGPLDEALLPRLAQLLAVKLESCLGVPLVVSGAIKGVLVVVRSAAPTDPVEDEWLLSALADQAAVAMEKTRLNEIGEFREQLIGIVSHDLRTPLSTILMAAQLLVQREGLGEHETQLARRITRSASQAVRLIEQLLDLTRSRLGGGIPIDPRPFDLNHVCRQLIGELELTHPDRSLRVDVRGDVKGVWDRDRLYQLLANLVGNAVVHGEPRSAIELRIDGSGDGVVIEVANRGEPIPPEMLPVIFDALRQGVTVQPARTHGLGLGLFIAQQIALAHGGAITATSSENDGTTFRVRLPRSAAVAP